MAFATKVIPASCEVIAPDGSDVRMLLALEGGGMAHFALAPNQCSVAVRHRTVEEIWFFLAGRGEMWRSDGETDAVVEVGIGSCITIPLGTSFQFRSFGPDALSAVAVTMPPWPADRDDEAIRADGPWPPTVAPGPGLADH
jgi:mannose-6-phosphate isomerase-like protein (cupin superfamily)